MTGPRRRVLVRDVLQVVLGPWPMSPWLILVIAMIVVHVTNLARFAGDGLLVSTNLSGAPTSVATGAAYALSVWASATRAGDRATRPGSMVVPAAGCAAEPSSRGCRIYR